MNRTLWLRILMSIGLAGMLLGAVDPLEGSLVILPGTGVAALGALLGKSRHRRQLCVAFGLVAVGVAAMYVLSAYGGIGGRGGHSMWWGVLVLPYPVGWFLGLLEGIPDLIRSYRRGETPTGTA
jgi:hypothetical protein